MPQNTKADILTSAKQEFLDKGFAKASLRTIASKAGVTTGALYRHFKDKDELFSQLVDSTYQQTKLFLSDYDFDQYVQEKSELFYENQIFNTFFNFLYENFDSYILLLEKAEGSKYSDVINEFSNIYTSSCTKILSLSAKIESNPADLFTVHVITNSFITSMAEIIHHRIPREQTKVFMENIHHFFHYGWKHLTEEHLSKSNNEERL